ncbi:MAG: hypothetical protein JNK93_16120 [Planctomycetia bacterium]|nr:hypothetical protein [Planctomycetia bacterium]
MKKLKLIRFGPKSLARFCLQAIGEKWDGRFVPIDELSYRPREPDEPTIIDTNPKPPSEE